MGLGIKHRGIRSFVLIFIALLFLGAGYFGYTRYARTHQAPGEVSLRGTVTKYDPTPSYVDGAIIFEIDGQAIDIGGGDRPDNTAGSVYSSIHVGDEVEAKVVRDANGGLTIYGCPECYIREHTDL